MLKLTNLYNFSKKLKIVIGVAFIAIPLHLLAAPPVSSDFFPFKIKETVYSAQDTLLSVEHSKFLNCVMFNESMLLKYINLHRYKKDRLTREFNKYLNSNKKEVSKYLQKYFQKVVTLIKLKKYIESQSFKINDNLYSIIKKSAKMNNCTGGSDFEKKGRFPLWMEDLVKLEMYFKSRFKDSAFVVGDSEVKNLLKNNKNKSITWAKAKLIKEKRLSSVNIFLQSVSKQVSHEHFW